MSHESTKSSRSSGSDRIPAGARRAAEGLVAGSDDAQFTRRRRRHRAAGGRVIATGISAGALFGVVGAIGAHSLPSTSRARRVTSAATASARRTSPRPAATPTTIVWRVVHRIVVVTDPPLAGASSHRAVSSWHPSYAPSPTYTPAAAASAVPTAPIPAPVVAAPPPAPAPVPAAPTCSVSKCP
jgi:hypothetical protein